MAADVPLPPSRSLSFSLRSDGIPAKVTRDRWLRMDSHPVATAYLHCIATDSKGSFLKDIFETRLIQADESNMSRGLARAGSRAHSLPAPSSCLIVNPKQFEYFLGSGMDRGT